MQLVIHSPFGSRVNRAWGLVAAQALLPQVQLRAAGGGDRRSHRAVADHAHSFELAEAARYLHSNSARQMLIQALCAAPMFEVRWRWDAGISLALPRFRGGKKIPPQIARMNAEDLLASVFPDQVACAENLPGEIEVPDHPLVQPDHSRLSRRRDGHRGVRATAARAGKRRHPRRRARSHRAFAARARGASMRGPMPFSTTPRWRSAARRR